MVDVLAQVIANGFVAATIMMVFHKWRIPEKYDYSQIFLRKISPEWCNICVTFWLNSIIAGMTFAIIGHFAIINFLAVCFGSPAVTLAVLVFVLND